MCINSPGPRNIVRERPPAPVPEPPPTIPTPEAPILEQRPERGPDWVAQQQQRPLPPPVIFQAAPPTTAAGLSAERVDKAAPQSLGGLAARFTIPTGKQGYSKSLRPEAGRLVR